MSFQSKEGLKTFEAKSLMPQRFSSIPGEVKTGTINLPQRERTATENHSTNLIQNIIRHTRFFDHSGHLLTLSFFSDNDNNLISLSPEAPQHLHDDAVGSLLFSHNVPILGLVSDYLRFAQKELVPNHQSQNHIDWSSVISSLMKEISFFDYDGNRFDKSLIGSVSNSLFTPKNELTEIFSGESEFSFSDAISGYVNQFFELDLVNGVAQVKDPSILNVTLGSAQRAVTPFSFGNCLEGCRFCYVDRRLSTIEYPNNWFRSLSDIDTVLRRYNPEAKSGPAQARMAMMDWEPTEHPQFLDIIKAIATKDPQNQIPIVTHGGSLTKELLSQIANESLLKKLLLFQVSLNSSDPQYRSKVMAGRGNNPAHHENAIASLGLMHELGIAFDVSIVATTNWVPMPDILQTINFADSFQPHSYIRVALPTATKDHNPTMLLSPEELKNIDRQIVAHRDQVKTPIILTVGLLNRSGLTSEIEGVMPGSAADYAGITHGSKIISINGINPRSRTESTLLLLENWINNQKGKQQPCEVVFILPNGQLREVDLTRFSQKNPRFLGDKPVGIFGLLIHDDVDFGIFANMKSAQENHGFKQPLMVTSEIMMRFFTDALPKLKDSEQVQNLTITSAKNYFFGGNVNIAGLLTYSDILESLKYADLEQKPDVIFVSASMMSRGGYDLQGYHYQDLANLLGVPVVPLKAKTGSL